MPDPAKGEPWSKAIRKAEREIAGGGSQDEGRTAKPVSHRHHQSLNATRAFDARFFSGASRNKDPRPDWPRPRRVFLRKAKKQDDMPPDGASEGRGLHDPS